MFAQKKTELKRFKIDQEINVLVGKSNFLSKIRCSSEKIPYFNYKLLEIINSAQLKLIAYGHIAPPPSDSSTHFLFLSI